MATFDTVTPAGGDNPAEADDRMREIKLALQERLNVEHKFDLTGTEVSHADTGKHTDITTLSIVNAGALANTGDFTLNTDKFTVDAATGNVVVAGTLDVAGTLGVTGVATLADGSKLATSAAPGADAELANKKYVDDHVGHDGDGYVLRDIDGVPTKVYTKYLTGNLDADATTEIAHGVNWAKILAVSSIVYDDVLAGYRVSESWHGSDGNLSWTISYNINNVYFSGVGSRYQGNSYRLKIDYYL